MLNIRMRKLVMVISVFTVLFVLYQLSFSSSNSNNPINKPIVARAQFEDNSLNFDKDDESKMHKSVLIDQNADSMSGSSPLFNGQKIVHLDLKGAAMKVSYYKEIFPLLHSLGATGLLIEYEDMFPYSSSKVKANNAYSLIEMKTILEIADENKLEVIPLVQTFGHLEFVLKLKEYSNLREVPRYPQVICPSRNGSTDLLRGMIDDVVSAHPKSRYIHIGCDEVYNLAECTQCVDRMTKNKWSRQQLFWNHVTGIARYIKQKYPKVTPLMWDDEFRKMSLNELVNSKVGGLVEPVVWKYTPVVDLPEDIWDKYSAAFGSVWIASAFKGATGSDKYVTDISYHLENHRAWMRIVQSNKDRVKFKGLVLTGWQRYDHFAVLCELFPVGMPSLAVNLAYLSQADLELQPPPRRALDVLRCGPGLLSPRYGARCRFPGSAIYDAANRLSSLTEQVDRMFDASQVRGWMTKYNVDTGFSSPAHVEAGSSELDRLTTELTFLEQEVTRAMTEVFDPDTAREWNYTYMEPIASRLRSLAEARDRLLSVSEWPKRPLRIHDQL